MSISLSEISQQLPIEDTYDYRFLNETLFKELNKTCVVIDDDPTGNQTVYDIPLLAEWDLETLIVEFKKETPTFFLLTNSRSLSQEASSKIYAQITKNILKASELTGRDFTIVSRSDSTLRGHFSEVFTIKNNLNYTDAINVFIPVMFEGNRVTVNDTHYVKEQNNLVPVNETPFAKDHTFSYKNANLKVWIQEKTNEEVSASSVFSMSIETIRSNSVESICEEIVRLKADTFCVFNALNYKDLDKVTQALLLAEKKGKRILYRTSSSFVPSYLGLLPIPLLISKKIVPTNSKTGGLTVVGSYVAKSSEQLNYALSFYDETAIVEIDVEKILKAQAAAYIAKVIFKINTVIASGKNIIMYTSRNLITGVDTKSNIDIGSKISNALVTMIQEMNVQPKYILAKGGITSHDLAVKGLRMKRSIVLGQIEPGIPVWKMGEETKFPKLPYIVFPGNVGDEKSLLKIIQKLS